jgi:hypothetical protein
VGDGYRVFAQDVEPLVPTEAWKRAAERFFATKLEITKAGANGASITIDGSVRRVTGRAREEADLRDALAADTRAGFTGLYDLAERRCKTVWVVEREGDVDNAALRLAAIIASVALGPILDGDALFGVRTAREKLL